jgi:hypothetical protein
VLLAVSRDRAIHRIELNVDGTRVVRRAAIVENLGSFPLDVIMRAAGPDFPASIWVCDHFRDTIHIVELQNRNSDAWIQRIQDAIELVRMKLSALAVY